MDRSKLVAIVTGAIALLVSIAYLLLVQFLDFRGGMQPAPLTGQLTPPVAAIASVYDFPGLLSYADADDGPTAKRFVAPDGTDLTAVAACLPKELSEPNFARALKESGNDFLERVLLNFRGTYSNRKLSESEIAYRECLQRKGIELDSGR